MKEYKMCEYARKGIKDSQNFYICEKQGNCKNQSRVSVAVTYCSRALKLIPYHERDSEDYELGTGSIMDIEVSKRFAQTKHRFNIN